MAQDLTAAQLANRIFELTGKSVKPSSYSKAKLISMIEAAEPQELDDIVPTFTEAHPQESPTPGYDVCPHCGIDHITNGWQDHDSLVADGQPGLTSHQYVCLACNKEFGPKIESTFTMKEVAAAAGVSTKAARARYRAVNNDNQRTNYIFPRSDWDQVLKTISPKRAAR